MEVESNVPKPQEGQKEEAAGEKVSFTLNFKREKYDITWPWDDKIASLRAHIAQLTGVPVELQKLMVKGTYMSAGPGGEVGLLMLRFVCGHEPREQVPSRMTTPRCDRLASHRAPR